MMNCHYYQAHVFRADCWFFVALLRSFEHVAFDRTLDLEASIFEFFVPQEMEQQFLSIMSYFQKKGIVSHLTSLPNRLAQ